MSFTPLELSILGLLGCGWLVLNIAATRRIKQCLGSVLGYGLNYTLLTWLIPVFGALHILAKLRKLERTHYRPISGNTINLDASRTGNWPPLGGHTRL